MVKYETEFILLQIIDHRRCLQIGVLLCAQALSGNEILLLNLFLLNQKK